jgi:thiamine-phosphate pyrophosphorylase
MPTPLCRLYLITPPAIPDLEGFTGLLRQALSGGDVACVQLRLKDQPYEAVGQAVEALKPIVQAAGAALVLNDRPDWADAFDCDGVHVGQGDADYAEARRIMGEDRIVGVTCHDSRHLAMEAAEAGADYVAFGAFYETGTKETTHRPDPSILTIWQETMQTPCVAIGGITVDKARGLAAAGADFIAVLSAVWTHPDGPAAAVEAFNTEIALGVEDRARLASEGSGG